MPKTKPFKNLLQQMTPEKRAKIETQVQLELLHLALVERKKSLGYTDEDIDLSEWENLDDISVSVLSQYIKALGGNLKLVANFPNQEVVAQFE
ncbi:MAG: transcriptional regulator [Scytonematopsis contorta HA4267-MV1]|jgi:hypothetical protein|nr:transcriptional regulator [Scytonematopsis contorta HA4267-MV1]